MQNIKSGLYCGIYLCLGYPVLETSLDALRILKDHPDIDFIELGLPFSDPVADGPIISAAAQMALKQAKQQNIGPSQMLDKALETLCDSSKDVYLMTYANMIYHLQQSYGTEVFNQLPIHGLIIPDVPLSEQDFFRRRGLRHAIIPFATPESTAQDLKLLAKAQGDVQAPFIYFVAMRGITGNLTDFRSPELRQQYGKALQAAATCPVVLGFGIQGNSEIIALAEFANGLVIGTAAVKLQGDLARYRQFLDSLF